MAEGNYAIGDTVWLYVGDHRGKKSKGTIVHTFRLDWGGQFYVVEVPSHIDPLLEVRDWFSLAESEDAPLGLFKLVARPKEEATR